MNHKKLFAFATILVFMGAFACSKKSKTHSSTHQASMKTETTQGFTSLFNGHNLKGWHSYLKDQPGSAWKVDDGTIALYPDSGSGGDLTTDGQYQNFVLKLDWKISDGGNSGIIFNIHESPKFRWTYLTGPEMQVLDNKDASDNQDSTHLAGSLYDLIAAPPSAVKPAGKWNKVKMKVLDGHITFWLNDKKVVDTQMWNDHWKKLVKNSKFSNWKEFATYKKGHIALQDHGHRVWYRNIKIKTL
jgi:hypothetical protein